MSAISSVGGNSLFQWLQQLTGTTPTTPTSSTASATATPDPTQTPDPTGAEGASGSHHHHHHGFASKIESAVTSALQNAPNGSDPNQVIKDAITQALQKGKPGQQGGQDADGDQDGSNTSANSATSSNAANGTSSSDAAFSQLLASYGISPQQFQQDLQSALTSQNTLNFATLFSSFPPGSLLQTTA